MQFFTIPQQNISPIISQMPMSASRAILFGGDRYLCCDEYVVCLEGKDLIAIASIAPHGEMMSGVPTIVGAWVHPSSRKQGIGKKLIEQTLSRCQERGFEKVELDALVPAIKKIYESFPEELKAYVILKDFSDFPSYLFLD